MCSVERTSKRKLNGEVFDEPGGGKKRRESLNNVAKLLKRNEMAIPLERIQLTPQQRKSLGLYNIESPKSVSPANNDKDNRRGKELFTGNRKSINSVVGTPLGRHSPRPSTPLGRRSVIPDEDVTAVYTECIKLSAANKINSKNAFGLRLIDCMPYLLKHKPNEQINFKLVSSALDAGAKIYGHRVDCVHAEAQKVASGLVIALEKDKDQGKVRGDDEEGDFDGDEINEDGETRPKKRKINKKTVKTIATNIDTINTAKVECNTPPDPLFSLLSSSFDIGNVNGLLMSNLTLNDDGLLLLNPAEIKAANKESSDVKVDRTVFDSILTQKPQIVTQLSRFQFLARGEELDSSMSTTLRAGTQTQDKISFAMDGGHSPSQDFEVSQEPPDVDDHHDPGGFFDHDSHLSGGEDDQHEKTVIETNLSQSAANQYLMRTVDSDGFDKLVIALSDQPSDYSYFNKELLGVWAGPEHWKLNPLARRSNLKKSQALFAPKSARKTKNQHSEIDFKQTLPTEEPGNKETKLKFSTLSNWTERLLPNDVAYEPMKLVRPFLKEGTMFSMLKKIGIDPNANEVHDIAGDGASDGRSSPGIDASMDGGGDNNYDDEFPPTQECFPTQAYNQDAESGAYAPFSGENLVDEPFLVSSTQLAFSTHAKKIDVKRLKKEMWTIVSNDVIASQESTQDNESLSKDKSITEDISDNQIEKFIETQNNKEQISEDELGKALPFSQMYKQLPNKVGTSMANNLSVPIAFVALLHLTNEKNLRLKGKPDMSDFFIQSAVTES